MPTAAKILIMLFRLVWLLGLAVGIWIWTGHGYATLNTHIALGFCTVLLLAIGSAEMLAGKAKRNAATPAL